MSETAESRERIARLETKIEHLEGSIKDMSEKVAELHDMLMRGKGAVWVLASVAAAFGFLASKLTTLIPTLR